MNNPYSFTIDELKTYYQANPNSRDIFVEGRTELFVLKKFLRQTSHFETVIYPIQKIEVLPETVTAFGQRTGSCKGRVITLLRSLANCQTFTAQAVGIVDKDYDHFLDNYVEEPPYVLSTDHHSMECYLLTSKTIEDFLSVVSDNLVDDAIKFAENLVEVLEQVGNLHLAHQNWQRELFWVDFVSDCSLEKESQTIKFDVDHFVDRFLSKNTRLKQKDEFLAAYEAAKHKSLNNNRLAKIRGHDLIELLTWFLRKRHDNKWTEIMVEAALWGHAEYPSIFKESLFLKLEQRLQA